MDHAPQIEPLYVFAVFMLGSRDAAFSAVCDVIGKHPGDTAAWLPALVTRLVAAEKAARFDAFAELTDILRTNSTIPVDVTHPLVQGDARRLSVLLWELQRSCLIRTLRGVPPEPSAVSGWHHRRGRTSLGRPRSRGRTVRLKKEQAKSGESWIWKAVAGFAGVAAGVAGTVLYRRHRDDDDE